MKETATYRHSLTNAMRASDAAAEISVTQSNVHPVNATDVSVNVAAEREIDPLYK